MTEPTYLNRPSKAARATAMFADTAEQDRREIKTVSDNLKFSHGAPSTKSRQDTWVARFEAFRTHTLEADLDKPFTGRDLWMFFYVMTKKLKPNQQHLPAPVRATFEQAKSLLIDYGTFHYDDFALTAQDRLKLKLLFDDAVYAGILRTGHQNPRELPSTTTSNNSDTGDEDDEPNAHKPTRVELQPVNTAQRKSMAPSRLSARTTPKAATNVASIVYEEEEQEVTTDKPKPTRTRLRSTTKVKRDTREPLSQTTIPSSWMTSKALNDVITLEDDEEEDEVTIPKPIRARPRSITNMTQPRLQTRTTSTNADNIITLSDDEDDVISHRSTRAKRTVYDSDDEPLHPRKKAKYTTPSSETSFDE